MRINALSIHCVFCARMRRIYAESSMRRWMWWMRSVMTSKLKSCSTHARYRSCPWVNDATWGVQISLITAYNCSTSLCRSKIWTSRCWTWGGNSRGLTWGGCECLLMPSCARCWAPSTKSPWTCGLTSSPSRKRTLRRCVQKLNKRDTCMLHIAKKTCSFL